MEIRSFLAFELPADIREIVSDVSRVARSFPLDVRWVKVDNIHLTVVFMGGVPSDQLKGVGDRVREVCLNWAPFDVSINGLGLFGNSRRPRVVWIGLKGNVSRLSGFRDALQSCLIPFGIKQEKRPFRPHLTLGRFRKGVGDQKHLRSLLSRYEDLTSPVCFLNELVLFKSELKPGGAVYTRLDAWPLTGAG
jgi:2'-5' RNA ligase